MNLSKIDRKTGLPAFLVIPQAQRDEVWRRNPPKAMPLMMLPVVTLREYKPLPELAAAKKARSIGKLKAWQREGAVKRCKDGVLRNTDGVPVRWNPMKSRFEPERQFTRTDAGPKADKRVKDASRRASPADADLTASGSIPTPNMDRQAVSDDIVQQIKDRCGMDVTKLKSFATANGVWDDKYASLPNPGLVRMNVVNRLRAKVRKGHAVVWS